MTSAFAFGRDRRLRKRADFNRVQDAGRRVSTRHFVLLLSARPAPSRPDVARQDGPPAEPGHATTEPPPATTEPSRLGLVVSRKVGNAVARARVKRLCRECFRTWPDLLPPGVDLVVIARFGASELSRDDVRAEWHDARRQIAKRAAEALARTPAPPHVGGRRGS